jgi:hypothetical protein
MVGVLGGGWRCRCSKLSASENDMPFIGLVGVDNAVSSLRLWKSCGAQLNVIYCIGSSSEMSKFPMSLFALRVLASFLRAIVVGAWCFGLGWVTTE